MYTIHCDGNILHDPRLEYQKALLIDPMLTLELNKQGTLEFRMPPTHPMYRDVKKLKSEISVYQDGEWLWSGRVLNDETDIYNMKSCDCEGELSYLIDSIQSLAEYHNTPVAQFFGQLMAKHNAQVGEHKRFTVGVVNVEDNNDSLYRFSNYETTWESVNDKLIDRLGGYIRTRRGVNGEKIIDYIADYSHTNTQTIEFGQNLLSFKRIIKGEDVATVLIPLGAKQESSEGSSNNEAVPRLTVASVNGGSIYVEDTEAIALYGRIVQVETWDDVNDASNLLTKGRAELLTRRLLSDSIELTAVDLHHLNVDVEKIKLGDRIRVFSIPHGLDIYMTVTKMVINLANVADTVITLGKTSNTLTDTTNANKSKAAIQKVVESFGYGAQITNNYNTIQEINNNVTLFGQRLDSETVTAEDLAVLIEAIEHLQEAIEKQGTLTSIDAAGGGTSVGKVATEVGKFDVDEPAIFRSGITIKDGGNEYDVLTILRNLGGIS